MARKKRRTKRYKVKGKLGTGARFKRLTKTLRRRGAKNPRALAAWIGRRKYGSKKMAKLAARRRKSRKRRR